ncbi:MAG TPA: RHS repeat-associated core domain-containing protein, partial [Saprospiraceae bacterium]|nr:RHS repeat-associated core domain-containing protein [Saprospiraceae bacterium]
ENTGSWTNLNRYNENLTYDLNGNILTLGRRGYISAGNWNTIDTLTYTYGNSSNPNWGTTIADGSGSALGYPNTTGTFSFDAAGNQTTYSAKGITSITYNHLNLPTKYTWSGGNTLEIQYDASGRKLAKVPSTGNSKTYVGSIEYSASAIEAIYHAEGRARLISSTWEYEYTVKDHLGNARVYFKYNGSISFLQENHYYPFGMEQGGWTAPSSPENEYKYNGKELNDEFSLGMYDYGARWYDPTLGRWGQVDPMAEKRAWVSLFSYVQNNPILRTDPTGALDEGPIDRILGSITAVLDNATGGFTGLRKLVSNNYSGDKKDFNAGLTQGDIVSLAVGTVEGASGVAIVEGSVAATVATGGLAIEVAAPAAVIGGVMTAHGTMMAGSAARNLAKDNGRVEIQGSGEGRGKHNRKPDSEAQGDHSVSNSSGSTTYRKNDQNPSGWQEISRTRTKGKPHGGVDPPYIKESGKPTRRAKPNEIPTDLSKNK